MSKFKTFLTFILCLCAIFCAAGCNGSEAAAGTDTDTAGNEQTAGDTILSDEEIQQIIESVMNEETTEKVIVYGDFSGVYTRDDGKATLKLEASRSDPDMISLALKADDITGYGIVFDRGDIEDGNVIIDIGEKGTIEVRTVESGESYEVIASDPPYSGYDGVYRASK